MRSSRPERASAGSGARVAPLGGSQRTGSHSLADEAAHALGESVAPGHGAAVGRHVGESELDLGGKALSNPDAQAVAQPFTEVPRVEHALRAEILPLGVGRREVLEPPRSEEHTSELQSRENLV